MGRGVAGGRWVLETGRLRLNPSPTLSTGRWVGMVGRSLGNLLPLSVFIHSASEHPRQTSFLICKMGIPSALQTVVRCRGGNMDSFVSCHGPAFFLCQQVLSGLQGAGSVGKPEPRPHRAKVQMGRQPLNKKFPRRSAVPRVSRAAECEQSLTLCADGQEPAGHGSGWVALRSAPPYCLGAALQHAQN